LCSALLLSVASPVAAAGPDPATLKQAQERFREGNRLFAAGDYEGARVAYQQSLLFVPHGSTYTNLGAAELKLGDAVAALKHLRMAMSAPDLTADKKATTQRNLGDAYAATGHIAIHTSPGASVTVDGKPVEGTAPFAEALDVAAGKHTFEAHLGGGASKFEVDVKPGQVSGIELAIAPPSTSPAPVPETAPSAPASTGSAQAPNTLPAVESDPTQAQDASFWTTRREVGLAVAGVGVLTLGAAAIFSVEASSQGNHARTLAAGLPSDGGCADATRPAGCGALQDTRNTQKTDSTMAGVFLGVGAAAFVAGAAVFFWPSPARGSQTAIVPYFSPQGGGLQLRGEL
jgi:hypothetical protein